MAKKDLEKITREFNGDYIISGPSENGAGFATLLWQDKPYFVWYGDYSASLKNETVMRDYVFTFKSKIPLKDILEIGAFFKRYENKIYDNYILVLNKNEKEFPELKNFELKKCYKVLCVYEPKYLQSIRNDV
jgi:hypothetical protein